MKRNFNKFLTLLIAGLFLTSSTILAQTSIKGKVVDGSGESLIGANVIVKGTSDGDVTDFEGNYTVSTSQALPFTLVFSYTGFTSQEITVSSNAPVNVTLVEGLLTDEVVISASRRAEKVQDAPASISVLSAKKLESTANSTDAARNLINVAGVQIQQQSANRINISMRGGSGLFGTSAFPILDYRSLVGPGIGTFQSDQSGISNIDLQRIEVVRGAGSALYGPGVTQGVIHFISKNPIDFPGTTVELMGGELNTFGVGVRHATKVSDKFGFKINAQYREGGEFVLDPKDADDAIQIAKFSNQIVAPAVTNGVVDVTGTPRVLLDNLDDDGDGNPMTDDWFNTAINATLEFRPKDNLSIVTSGGFNQASSVFYNEQGEGLAQAKEFWGQARVQAGGLFAQAFVVQNDGGADDAPTFLYQTGNSSSIARTQVEAQIQYNTDLDFLNSNWTAGVDYRFAGQDTKNLVYGRNEDDDDYSVVGAYVQGKMELSKKIDLVVAGRYDQFNFIDEGAFAPRAALVYKINPKHTLRGSYNRTNSTVSNLQLNIDFPLVTVIPGGSDVWLYGNKTTQTFNNAEIAFFSPALPNVPVGTPGLPLGVPFANVNQPTIDALSAGLGMNPDLAPLVPVIAAVLGGINPATLGTTGSFSPGFNLFDGTPLGIQDAPISKISTGDQFEIGYKGLIKDKLGVTLDFYTVTEKNNSQFTAISPAYLLQGLDDELAGDLGAAVAAAARPQLEAALLAQMIPQPNVDAILGGLMPVIAGAYTQGGDAFLNTPSAAFGGLSFSQLLGALPFHATVPTDQVPDNGVNHLAAGYRTFDERTFVGADLGLEYYFNNDISAFFNYSWVNKIEFEQNVVGNEGAGALPTYLNIPKNKFRLGLNYLPELGFRGSISFQHDDAYVASAGQFSTFDTESGKTDPRNLVDMSLGYKFDFGLAIDASASNVFNNEYRYLPNMPKIGRRALVKLVYEFGVKK